MLYCKYIVTDILNINFATILHAACSDITSKLLMLFDGNIEDRNEPITA